MINKLLAQYKATPEHEIRESKQRFTLYEVMCEALLRIVQIANGGLHVSRIANQNM